MHEWLARKDLEWNDHGITDVLWIFQYLPG